MHINGVATLSLLAHTHPKPHSAQRRRRNPTACLLTSPPGRAPDGTARRLCVPSHWVHRTAPQGAPSPQRNTNANTQLTTGTDPPHTSLSLTTVMVHRLPDESRPPAQCSGRLGPWRRCGHTHCAGQGPRLAQAKPPGAGSHPRASSSLPAAAASKGRANELVNVCAHHDNAGRWPQALAVAVQL